MSPPSIPATEASASARSIPGSVHPGPVNPIPIPMSRAVRSSQWSSGARSVAMAKPPGKVDGWFQTNLRECLGLHWLASEDDGQRAKASLVEYQNNNRPHLCIEGLTPISRPAARSTIL